MSTNTSTQPKIDESWVCNNSKCKKRMTARLPLGDHPMCCGQAMCPPANLAKWFKVHCVHRAQGCPYWETVPPGKTEYRCQHKLPDKSGKVCGQWMVPFMEDNFDDM
ncbi:hypothetical protein HYALB_00010148 [Hymenoscyphus albidus]|uniref:Uncharacterized protein n=1 Tax=Hymenoscyphus albidus TaxID=595503 RepID=A0A9N9M0C0_9HELO|nr:hypothetical protein HYALB_00010148 [Hymenoscyphus albidus]